jgi:Protein of unknown function (DUF732)
MRKPSVLLVFVSAAVASLPLTLLPAAPAHADDSDIDFVSFLEQHNLGCGEGSIKCSSDTELIPIGHAICHDIDTTGDTPNQAADFVADHSDGWINRMQSYALVAAAVVNYCPWDKIGS